MSLFEQLISPKGLALDRHLVRYTGYSLVNIAFARQTGISAQPALLLRTQGRKTGLWRDLVLPWFYLGNSRVVVGSNGGQAVDPQWVRNLRAHPQAEIFVNRSLQVVQSRFLEREEYQLAWQGITKTVPAYLDYQRDCEGLRQIPLIALDTA
jgi:deazaflavin-dependent oxidoreductase (nitroreductase family)